jgi:hypothetical protein
LQECNDISPKDVAHDAVRASHERDCSVSFRFSPNHPWDRFRTLVPTLHLRIVESLGNPMSFEKRLQHMAVATITTFLLAGCGGSSDPDVGTPAPPPGTNGQAKALVIAVSEANGPNCPYGGSKVNAGADANANGALDSEEVTSVQYVCNGAPGAAGAPGAKGLSSLVQTSAEPAGANCSNGGTKILVGFDLNSDGALAASEVTSTGYVCNGATGANGASGSNGANGTNGSNGANGTNGSNGANGTNGADGLSSLIAIVPESGGANCTHGGTRFTSGLDSNQNGVLDASEVTSTTYSCNPPPASGLIWLDAPVDTAAIPNRGYLASGAARVTITLPASPAVGDTVSVSGIGTGGFTIAPNVGQHVLVRGLPVRFIPRFGPRSFGAIASSADGTHLIAAESDTSGSIFTSSDSGVTWTPRDSLRSWARVASSSDGSKLLATVSAGTIYVSSDFGVTWTASSVSSVPAFNGSWQQVAISGDGSKAVAISQGGSPSSRNGVYVFDATGLVWTQAFAVQSLNSVAISADGSKIYAAGGGGIYGSTDGGVAWGQLLAIGGFYRITSSADGTRLFASGGLGLHVSIDAGTTWVRRSLNSNLAAIGQSADGSTLLALNAVGNDGLATSSDGGVTWSSIAANTPLVNANLIATSADLNRVLVFDSILGSLSTASILRTSIGTLGAVEGGQFDAVDLQYIGNGVYIVRASASASGGFAAR